MQLKQENQVLSRQRNSSSSYSAYICKDIKQNYWSNKRILSFAYLRSTKSRLSACFQVCSIDYDSDLFILWTFIGFWLVQLISNQLSEYMWVLLRLKKQNKNICLRGVWAKSINLVIIDQTNVICHFAYIFFSNYNTESKIVLRKLRDIGSQNPINIYYKRQMK